jgi:hypothetical protein
MAKRFIVTDTLGLLLTVVVVTAAVQDRDGAKPALLQAYLCTRVRFVFTDGAFAGRLLDWAYTILRTTLHIVPKPADQRGFVVIPPVGLDSEPRGDDLTIPDPFGNRIIFHTPRSTTDKANHDA